MLVRALATAVLLAASSHAAALQLAVVTIESSGSGLTLSNTTVDIPLLKPYHNATALAAVASLYLTGAQGVPLDSITCRPFKEADGRDADGDAFNSSAASLLTTDVRKIGSIVCQSNTVENAPPPVDSSSSSAVASSSSSSSSSTDTAAKSATSSSGLTTITSGSSASASSSGTVKSATSTATSTSSSASASASSSPANHGVSVLASSEFFTALALAGLGFAFVL